MPQSAEKIKDFSELFNDPEYQTMLAEKREKFEVMPSADKVAETLEWTKSWEYREKNFAREAAVINPAKACQPLGAVFCSAGFADTLSFVHGSQGCVAYYRSHLIRHFKEPSAIVSSSMTEDAAVFGGLSNMVDGLANAYKLYAPKVIAVSTTCTAEVIGDDLAAFIEQSRQKGSVPADMPIPNAHTPAFVGSHVQGYDNMLHAFFDDAWEGRTRTPNDKINIIPGFDGFCVGNLRELKRILGLMGIEYTIIADTSDVFDTPSDGTYQMYSGGTTYDELRAAQDAKATISMQQHCTSKSLPACKAQGHETADFHYPLGVSATDAFLMKLSELTGKPIPDALTLERGRLVDALTDSQAILHGKRFALYGDPDFVIGMTRFLLEVGAEPIHVLATNGTKAWAKKVQKLLDESPSGQGATVWPGKDLWHMRSLMLTEPVDFLIGNSHGKYLERDTGTPLIRLTFPIFDRHHHHRFPVWGYQGGLHLLVKLVDKVLDVLDAKTGTLGKDIAYDLTR